jgi:hypothetical protein
VVSPEAENGTTVNFRKFLEQRENPRGFTREKQRSKEREEGVMGEESVDLAHRCTGVKPRAAARTEAAIWRAVERWRECVYRFISYLLIYYHSLGERRRSF